VLVGISACLSSFNCLTVSMPNSRMSGSSSLRSGFSKHDPPSAWIDVHRNHVVVSAGEPRVGFPISLDPLHDGFVDIAVPSSTADSDADDLSIPNGEIYIDTERLIVAALLLAEKFPLERGSCGIGPWRLRCSRVARRARATKREKERGEGTALAWWLSFYRVATP
jgi:hypothetical protein